MKSAATHTGVDGISEKEEVSMKQKLLCLIELSLFLISVSGCVVKSSQMITDVAPPSGKRVEVKTGGVGVLSLTTPKLDQKAQERIRAQCSGEMVNVNSQLTRRDFFIVQYYVLTVTGDCKE